MDGWMDELMKGPITNYSDDYDFVQEIFSSQSPFAVLTVKTHFSAKSASLSLLVSFSTACGSCMHVLDLHHN